MASEQDTTVGSKGTAQEKRRRLLRAGLAAAPILMTVASRPAFGCHSTTPSAFGSINASRPDVLIPLSGRSPGYWKQSQHFNDWPSGYYPKTTTGCGGHSATLFSACFPGSRGTNFSGKTLLDVLNMQGGGEIALARAMSAALLNAAAHRTDAVLGVLQVKNIWLEYVTRGFFEPTAGIKWYIDTPVTSMMTAGSGGIIGYLNTTWS